MAKSKFSASSIAVPSILVNLVVHSVVHLVNGAQFLNANCAEVADVTVILPFTKMEASYYRYFIIIDNLISYITICTWFIIDNTPFSCHEFRIV